MCFEVEFNQTGGIIWFDLTARGLNLHNSGGSRMINIIYIGDLSPAYATGVKKWGHCYVAT